MCPYTMHIWTLSCIASPCKRISSRSCSMQLVKQATRTDRQQTRTEAGRNKRAKRGFHIQYDAKRTVDGQRPTRRYSVSHTGTLELNLDGRPCAIILCSYTALQQRSDLITVSFSSLLPICMTSPCFLPISQLMPPDNCICIANGLRMAASSSYRPGPLHWSRAQSVYDRISEILQYSVLVLVLEFESSYAHIVTYATCSNLVIDTTSEHCNLQRSCNTGSSRPVARHYLSCERDARYH